MFSFLNHQLIADLRMRINNAKSFKVGDRVTVIDTPLDLFSPNRFQVAENWRKYQHRQANIIAIRPDEKINDVFLCNIQFDDGDVIEWNGHMLALVEG